MRERFGRLGAELRSRARDQARWLIRDHGDLAEAILAAKLNRSTNSAADRYRYRRTERELRQLRELESEGRRRSGAMTIWEPPAIGLGGWLAKLTGAKRKDRRPRS